MTKENGILWASEGIGGDDRCGVYAILKILEKYKPYVLFTTDEETGGVGASSFAKEISQDLMLPVNFAIEIDRRGYNQAVFYDCGNKDFIDFILSFGFDEEFGTYTDICEISPAFDIASVNLSAGYYNEHTKHEHIVLEDLNHTIEMIKRILSHKRVNDYFDFQEIQYTYTNYNTQTKLDDLLETETEKYNKATETSKASDAYEIESDLYSYKKPENSESKFNYRDVMLDDWYEFTDDEWEEKYKEKKPASLSELYKTIYIS